MFYLNINFISYTSYSYSLLLNKSAKEEACTFLFCVINIGTGAFPSSECCDKNDDAVWESLISGVLARKIG